MNLNDRFWNFIPARRDRCGRYIVIFEGVTYMIGLETLSCDQVGSGEHYDDMLEAERFGEFYADDILSLPLDDLQKIRDILESNI